MPSISACAWTRVTPGFSRPKAPNRRSPRGACARSSLLHTHTSTLPMERSSGGMTPAML